LTTEKRKRCQARQAFACVSVDLLTLTYIAALVIQPATTLNDDPTLTTRDAARLLGISVSTAQKWIESGALESWKTPGGHRRMRQSAVIALLEERTAMSADSLQAMPQELRPERSPPYPVPRDEAARLRMVGRTGLLDTAPDPAFDRITWLAALIADTPISVISLITAKRQWFKSALGTALTETPRDQAFCNLAILSEGMLMVEDAREDARFSTNPLVTGDPHIRFYAGCVLRTPDGHALGSLCVVDRTPRRLDAAQKEGLRALADIAEDEIRLYMVEHGRRWS
jgi:excisionase family DNA binding protein